RIRRGHGPGRLLLYRLLLDGAGFSAGWGHRFLPGCRAPAAAAGGILSDDRWLRGQGGHDAHAVLAACRPSGGAGPSLSRALRCHYQGWRGGCDPGYLLYVWTGVSGGQLAPICAADADAGHGVRGVHVGLSGKAAEAAAGLFHGEPGVLCAVRPDAADAGWRPGLSSADGLPCPGQGYALPGGGRHHLLHQLHPGGSTAGHRPADAGNHVVLHPGGPLPDRDSAHGGIREQVVPAHRQPGGTDPGLWRRRAGGAGGLRPADGGIPAAGGDRGILPRPGFYYGAAGSGSPDDMAHDCLCRGCGADGSAARRPAALAG
ncbi:tRNA glutamyl-Q(34) synthetase GluQRS, partial [Dysosmobacter welbionis]